MRSEPPLLSPTNLVGIYIFGHMNADVLLLAVYAAVTIGVFIRGVRPSLLFAGGVLVAWIGGALDIADWTATLSNKSLLTLFTLTLLAGVVQQRLGINSLLMRILPNGKNPRYFLLSLYGVTSSLSSLINNTPLVAILIPFVKKWSEKNKQSLRTFLMPMAFAATAGGMLTAFGTSTNLVLNGLLEASGQPLLFTSDYLLPGLMVVLLVGVTLVVAAPLILKSKDSTSVSEDPSKRSYTVETRLLPEATAVGKSVSEAGFRNLHDLFLVEILRNGRVIAPVSPEEVLEASDRLFFAGDLAQIRRLTEDRSGLALPQSAVTDSAELAPVVEALIPQGSSIAGMTVKECDFRHRFGAAIVAIHRQGKHLGGRIGDQKLRAGDLLVLIGTDRMEERLSSTNDLYPIGGIAAEKQGKDPLKVRWFLGAFVVLVALAFAGWTDLFGVSIGLLFVGTLLGFVPIQEVRKHLDLELLVVLSASLALGQALVDSPWPALGVEFASSFLDGLNPWGIAMVLFLTTTLVTNAVTNNAAVVIAFPMAVAIVNAGYLPSSIAYLSIAFGASNAFMTPIGYQTNLMVMGPGGYTGKDYFRMGGWVTWAYTLAFGLFLLLLL